MRDGRIWEIDFARAAAIILMMTFHLIYDLNEFLGIDVNYEYGFWYWVGKVSALIFIFLAGISSGLSRQSFKRGIKVFIFGMIITAATFVFDREEYVRFGILHFLGVCMLLYPFLNKLRTEFLLVIVAVSVPLGFYVGNLVAGTSLLLPFGLMYKGFVSMDYYPLFPYIGAFILGMICFKIYYYKRKSLFNFQLHNSIIQAMSKNSLIIYMIHQPVILGLILLIKAIK